MFKKKCALSIGSVVILTFLLGGCATGGRNETGGTVVGGVAGALIGSQFGGGSGHFLGAALGGLGGAFVGNKVGKSMDSNERSHNR